MKSIAGNFGGRARALLVACALVAACTPAPRPRVLEEVDRTRSAEPARVAEALAPQAYLAAEKLRQQAVAAAEEGDLASSQILGEHALTAYSRAFALARLAKAEQRRTTVEASLKEAQGALDELDAQQARAAAEVEDIEMRVKVARDALPLVPSGVASPDREKARLEAARALALQGRLLCTAAKLLSPEPDSIGPDLAALDSLDKQLDGSARATPIDEAGRLRSRCLSKLAAVRRPALRASPAQGVGDALLAQLSQARFEPFRDDRGVVVVLRGLFGAGDAPSKEGSERLTALGQVARERPDTPVLVVVHSSGGATTERDRKRSEAAVKALEEAGAPRAEGRAAGGILPVVPKGTAGAAHHNERVEVVFVTPSW